MCDASPTLRVHTGAYFVILKNHWFKKRCSTLAPDRHDVPSANTCTTALCQYHQHPSAIATPLRSSVVPAHWQARFDQQDPS
jgi:hypothetical protein